MDNLFVSNEVVTTLLNSNEVAVLTANNAVVAVEKPVSGDAVADPGYVEGGDMGTGTMVDPNMPQVKDPLLSSWPFVIGISAAVLFVSVVLGILLAKRKIKKGIELYED